MGQARLPKRFGICLMPNGETVILATRATTEVEAAEQLHAGYRITMVLDIVDADTMNQLRNKRREA